MDEELSRAAWDRGGGALRRAVSLLVAGLPPGSREGASGELMRTVESIYARERAPFGGVGAVPLDLIRAELRQAASETSWRHLARELKLNARTLQLVAEQGTTPRPSTETRLRRWAIRRSGDGA